MKKTVSIAVVLSVCLSVFALNSGVLSVSPNVGFGMIDGIRYITTDGTGEITDRTHLAARGVETGVRFGYQFGKLPCGSGIEVYFNYLFATKGAWSTEEDSLTPVAIEEKQKYTDYKAGLGYFFRFPLNRENSALMRIALGANFAGVSSHYFNDENLKEQYDGHKVTSFGIYLASSVDYKIKNNIALTANVHCNLNGFGFIRHFIPETGKWKNYFPSDGKTTVKLFSLFFQVGMTFEL